jgi:DNA-binding beta-propeller fold protein YncE
MLSSLTLLLALGASNSIALPGGPPVAMDYLVYDARHHRIWVPAGNTGNVDVVDTATGTVTPIGGFVTRPSSRSGRPRMGPSSATVGDGVIWVGNRGDDKVCRFDAATLEKGTCLPLAAMPDGLAYVASTHEVWITTPHDQTLTVVDEKSGKITATLKVDGSPEGYAVDQQRAVFFTNLEDRDQTLAIDVKARKVTASWSPGCGKEGPRGLALDSARHLLVVACTDGARVLDLNHEGKVVGQLKTGGGVDNLDYFPERHLLYVASSRDAKLTLATLADDGALSVVATDQTADGARNPVVDDHGVAYVPDAQGGRLIVVKPPSPR